jgi:hypothetical protein
MITQTKVDELIAAAADVAGNAGGYQGRDDAAFKLIAGYRIRRLREAVEAIADEVPRRERTWESDLEEDR